MASTATGRRLTEAHRLAQVKIAQLTVLQMRQLWPLLDAADTAATSPAWLNAALRLINTQHATSATVSARYYQAFRILEAGAPFAGRLPAAALNGAAVRTTLMVTGPVRIERARRRGDNIARAARTAFVESARESTRHSLAGGRDTLLGAVRSDRRALGFARVTSGNPCAFCAMLASRGPVYQLESADFQSHAGCACSAEPVYTRDADWPPGAREARDLWNETKIGNRDALNAFRRAYEGRA